MRPKSKVFPMKDATPLGVPGRELSLRNRVATPIRVLLLVGLFISLSGCGLLGKKVSAFEKANLAKPGMALVAAPKEQAHMNHMFNAREGSVGGFGGAGGGCGCN